MISDMSFSIDTINECISEIKDPIPNKSKYFDGLVMQRLEKCNSLYMKDFDAQLKKIVEYANSDECDVIAIGSMMKKLSRLTNSLYKSEISLYRSLCKGD